MSSPSDQYETQKSAMDALINQISTVSFHLGQDSKITKPSSTLCHYLPTTDDSDLAEIFDVIRPAGAIDFKGLKDTYGAMVLLVAKDQSFAIRGQFVAVPEIDDSMVFVGSPWLSWITQNAPDTQIRMRDFAATDGQLDQLIFLSTEQQNLKDLKDLTEELKTARDKAEQTNEIQSRFFALMSHEMRTPLNGVASALDLIDERQLQGESLKMLEIARNSSSNLKRVVNQVLNYSKLQAGGFGNEANVFDLKRTLSSVIDLHTPFAQQQGNSLIFEGITEPAFFNADEAKLRQVLINLVGNALKFTTEGQVRIYSEFDEKSRQLTIRVKDTGEGIPLVLQPRIFESYWTFESNRGGSKGTGLGLNICKQFVDIMGGDICFESTLGEGTVFEIKLPVDRADVDKSTLQDESVEDASYFKGQVLLAEDNKTNQYLIQLLLERRGLTVYVADSGVEAIAQVEANDYDLVFMDISMPVMDGLEATQKLREKYTKNQLPIVAMTAHAGDEDHNRFISAGMNSAMSKTVDLLVLNATLARWCELDEAISDNAPASEEQVQEMQTMDIEFVVKKEAEKLLAELGAELFVQIADVFQGEANERLGEILAVHKAKENKDLAKKAHSIRSSAATLGCMLLADQLKAVELQAREVVNESDWVALDPLIKGLPELVTKSLTALKDYSAALSQSE